MFASSSLVALLVGAGESSAFAQCVDGGGGYDNPASTTIGCIAVANTSFAGSITNEGTISPSGITVTNSGITGSIQSTGTLAGGITIDASSSLTSTQGPAIDLQGSFAGGVTNFGTISSTGTAISVSNASVFSGGITNSGTITVGANGILLQGISTFFGGITNSGTISAGSVGISIQSVAEFTAQTSGENGPVTGPTGVTNAGVIVSGGNGIEVNGGSFSGGIVNSSTGVIIAGANQNENGPAPAPAHGISVTQVLAFANGITNAGTISATGSGVNINNVGTFTDGITNSGTITAGANGILVQNVSTFFGGITNSGTISASSVGISIQSVAQFEAQTSSGENGPVTGPAGVTNAGVIVSGGNGIEVNGGSFSGGIVNSSTGVITAGVTASSSQSENGPAAAPAHGISVTQVLAFANGITNAGTISATGNGININSVGTFADGITNSGTITAGANGILVQNVSTFFGGITNSGTISASSVGISIQSVAQFEAQTSSGENGPVTGPAGVTNAGVIVSGGNGIEVNGGSFSGGIVNSSTGVITAGVTASSSQSENGPAPAPAHGISVTQVLAFANGITNAGTISATGSGVNINSVGTFTDGIANSGTITAGANGIYVNSVSTFAGGIANSGTITASGGNGIDVQSVQSFAGGITNSGTISASGVGILVGAGGVTFSGSIDNTGTITGGTAAIDVSAAATASTINQISGALNGAVNLSANADIFNIKGGTVAGDIVGSGTAGTVNFDTGGVYTSANAISGVATVNVLSGTTLYDNTTIGATDVIVAGGAKLGPAASGTISALTITGNLTFSSGSSYIVTVDAAGNSSKTTVDGASGKVTINGGTVMVTLLPGNYGTQVYTLINSTGAVAGTFGSYALSGASFSGYSALTYDLHDVYLNLTSLVAAPNNLTTNGRAVADAVNAAILAGLPLPPSFQQLQGLNAADLTAALNQIAGQVAAGVTTVGFDAGDAFLNLLINPFLGMRDPDGTDSALGYAPNKRRSRITSAFAAFDPKVGGEFDTRYRAWGQGYGGSSNISGNNLAGTSATSTSLYGVAAGLDYHVSPNSVVGFGLSGGSTGWSVADGSGRSDLFQAGVYGSTRQGPLYLAGALAYSWHDVRTTRTVMADTLQAKFNTNLLGARFETGYRYDLPWMRVTPYTAAEVQTAFLPSYGETATTGSNAFALSYDSRNVTTTRTELGTWFDKSYKTAQGMLTIYSRAAWAHDFNRNEGVTATFQSLPGISFAAVGAASAADSALLTAGAAYKLPGGWSVLGKFEGKFSATTTVYGGTGTIRKTW